MEEKFYYLGETLQAKVGTVQAQEKSRVDEVSSEI